MFVSDQPIKSCSEDILGRDKFAKALAGAILNYNYSESIVIGLFGEWGSGKTSILNMAIESIEDSTKDLAESPIITRFNPWLYSDQEKLIFQFFEHLSKIIKRTDYAKNAQELGTKLEKYANIFKPLSLIPTVGPIASLASELLSKVGIASQTWADIKEQDLILIKDEIVELLKNQSNKIIVVIDDIDRLNNKEIRQIFQLIKSIADFPNTIYLVAFDKQVVINALAKVQEGKGSEYLEKIVQIPFEVPQIDKSEITSYLTNQLNELLEGTPSEYWDITYFSNIYHSGLKYFFRNIRDVVRYLNSLKFNYRLMVEEVNPIDFLAITGIQIFEPDIYYGIRNNKNIFSGLFGSTRGNNSDEEQEKEKCDSIIKQSKVLKPDRALEFLKRIFPRLNSIYGNMGYGDGFLKEWRKKCRICSPDMFERYFQLSISNNEITQKEMNSILELAADTSKFSSALLSLNENGKIGRFLERMEDYTGEDIPTENIQNIVSVLFNLGDLFPEGDIKFFGIFDTPMVLMRLVYQLTKRLDTQEQRFNVLKESIEKTETSLYPIVYEIGLCGQEHGRYTSKSDIKPESERRVNETQLDELEHLVCNKIKTWAEDGRLAEHHHLSTILFRWKTWDDGKASLEFVAELIKTDKGLIRLLSAFLNKVTSQGLGDYVAQIKWVIKLDYLKLFIKPEEIEPRARKILSSDEFESFDQQDQLGIKIFLDTLDGKIDEPI